MGKEKSRKMVAGAAWLMVTLAASSIGLRLTNWANANAKLLDGAIATFTIFSVTLFVFWYRTKDDSGNDLTAQKQDNSVKAGRDAIGTKQLNAKYLTYNEAAPVASPPSPPPQEQPEAEKSKLDFEVKAEWVWLVYKNAPGCWIKSTPSGPTPRRSFIVYFTRNEPPKGEKTGTAISLVAILKFTDSLGSERVSRAYWLGRNNNQIDFEAGHQEAVVVGSCEGPLFSSYLNKFSLDGSNEFFASTVRGLGDRKTMHTAEPISVQISLFDVYANTTVEAKKFVISISGSTVSSLEAK